MSYQLIENIGYWAAAEDAPVARPRLPGVQADAIESVLMHNACGSFITRPVVIASLTRRDWTIATFSQ